MYRPIALLRALLLIGAASYSSADSVAQEHFELSQDRVGQSFGRLAVNRPTKRFALWLATGDSERDPVGRHIAVFDFESRRLVKALPPPAGVHLSSLEFTPDGLALISGESGSVLRAWNTDTWTDKILWEDGLEHQSNAAVNLRQLAISSSGDAIALHGKTTRRKGESIHIIDARSSELRSTIEPTGVVNDIVFSRDGSYLAIATANAKKRGKVEFWDIRTGQLISTLSEGSGPLLVELSPQQDVMATLCFPVDQQSPPTLKLWSLSARPTKSDFSRFQASEPDCLCAAFSPSGAMLAVGQLRPARRVTVYDIATKTVRYALDHKEGQSIANVAFADEGHLIVTIHKLAGEKGPTVLLWELPESNDSLSGSQK